LSSDAKNSDRIAALTAALSACEAARSEAQALCAAATEGNRLKDELLAAVAYELRTPTNAILGWTNLLAAGQLEPDDYRHAIAAIERNAEAQNKLINDLLDLGQITSGTLALELAPVGITEVVRAALRAATPHADARGITLTAAIEARVGTVAGDAARLRQVVSKLLESALNLAPAGGTVALALTRESASVVIDVTVAATAVKVAPDEKAPEGDGAKVGKDGPLGLLIAGRLAEMHGGRMTTSVHGPGHGRSFAVTLPALAAERRFAGKTVDRAPRAVSSTSLAGLKVLIVDDQVDVLSMLKLTLHRYEAEVVAEDNVADALEQYRCFGPDLIISDVGMPELGGYDFVRQIRSLEAAAATRTPIIALTAHVRFEDREQALAEGFDLHLAKPIEPDSLVLELVRLAQLHRLPGRSRC
jgi:CheY-like chemotaxis protein